MKLYFARILSHTFSMKIAISVPDDIFERGERFAHRTKKSRSQLYSDALKEFVSRHSNDEVTEAMDRTCALVNDHPDPFVLVAGTRTLVKSEW